MFQTTRTVTAWRHHGPGGTLVTRALPSTDANVNAGTKKLLTRMPIC